MRDSTVWRAFIYVSEDSGKKGKSSSLILLVAVVSSFVFSGHALASVVNGEFDYQVYRDFAENKGQFTPGASNIPIFKRDNKTGVPDMMMDKPVPDFSSVNNTGIATLLAPSYIASVAHNGGYTGVTFGYTNYNLVARNIEGTIWAPDFHAPRLDKFVVDAAPANMLPFDMYKEGNELNNKTRFTNAVRLGSGAQQVSTPKGNVSLSGAYSYLTGGIINNIWYSSGFYPLYKGGTSWLSNGNNKNKKDVLDTYPLGGDSGSPYFVWDNTLGKWEVVGVLHSTDGTSSHWSHINKNFLESIMSRDTDPVVSLSGNHAVWGKNHIEADNKQWEWHGIKGSTTSLNDTKHLVMSGGGDITLLQSVDQGAGGIIFDENNRYAFNGDAGVFWKGAGLDVGDGTVVDWNVSGVKGDNLHKIGAGTLKVNGTGINEGGLKVGDGMVILAQKPDENGRVQAFSSVNISSGRPAVVLSDNRQVNPDNISWGFRGGVLDINGTDILFHNVNAADNGAVITNGSALTSLLTISPVSDLSVTINDWDRNWRSGGEKGLLYKYNNSYTHTTDYFVQNKKGYGYFPINQSNNPDWEYIGHDEQTAKNQVLSRRPKDNFLFHGNLTGNMNVRTDTSGSTGGMAFDGNMNLPGNTVSQSGGELTFQGHPVIHAFNTKATADRLASLGDTSVRTQPVSFNQPDWETRTFLVNTLSLKDASFRLARNAVMTGDINANHSGVTLGSPSLWIDLNDGTGKKTMIKEGVSVARHESDMSEYHGHITLNNQSTLDIREKFSGGITASNSSVSVASRQAALNEYSMFRKTPLTLQNGARLTATGGWYTDGAVNINHDATLSLGGTPRTENKDNVSAAYYASTEFSLAGDGSRLQILPWTFTYGNISADGKSVISVGEGSSASLAPDLSFREKVAYSTFYGFKNVYGGRVYGPRTQMSLSDTQWQISGDSTLDSLRLTRSLAGFTGGSFAAPLFLSLDVNNLTASQSAFALRTDLKNSDKIIIRQHAEGINNTLFVNFLRKPSDKDTLNILLVSAPAGTDPAMFKAAERVTGFSQVTPRIHTEEKDGMTRWVLDGFNVKPDKRTSFSANTFLNMGYKNFLTEVNNLNKRMGDLRDTQGEDGLWVRVMNGAGTGDDGYSDRYTHFQFGFDRKHRLNGADLFTGVLMSHTDSHAGSSAFSGETRSLGGGMYASLMLDSGAYVDVIGKYVHHDNDYTARFAGPEKQDYGTHSWYAGAEVGYRYTLPGEMYLEPQAELVYGAVSGSRFHWRADGMDMSMSSKHYNPLTGRTGVSSGKTFTGKDWQVTTRAGVDYQFDLVSNGETALRDASGEHRFTGEKDSRMLYNVGINARLKENTRFGVELEQSAFGKYNVDHVINANLRYMF
ncbi:TPA_asm: autotransporter outer membrane beta-barrel domain-containing protein [Salmonella enterica]|nr:autotransporter outer membrane beta-barrel domain-containing protein [Salmonella enterica]EAO7618997.1 autotransporter outer membrane beta-barrel domain-containing protein [Salmonella enterica]EAQ6819554.1 autotransporter outer membrane beta-barrel domain-containing protein [Salmonella enterica]HAC8239944.1 autotransporter outer membrane beta-barrel domain-containing protein [Salmonella enterica]HAC8273484.1 autotransporter outer membrane beta-barrel domain-containing protein [Salmonella ent